MAVAVINGSLSPFLGLEFGRRVSWNEEQRSHGMQVTQGCREIQESYTNTGSYAGLDINACPGQVDFLEGQVKEKFTCPTGQ